MRNSRPRWAAGDTNANAAVLGDEQDDQMQLSERSIHLVEKARVRPRAFVSEETRRQSHGLPALSQTYRNGQDRRGAKGSTGRAVAKGSSWRRLRRPGIDENPEAPRSSPRGFGLGIQGDQLQPEVDPQLRHL